MVRLDFELIFVSELTAEEKLLQNHVFAHILMNVMKYIVYKSVKVLF